MANAELALTGQIDLSEFTTAAIGINDNHKTTKVTAESILARTLEDDDDYSACVALSNEAAKVEKSIEKNFDGVCDLRHKLWKAATAERSKFADPWGKLKEDLRKKAATWYLEQQRAKAQAERELGRIAEQAQRSLADKAQDLIDQGYVKEGRQILMQAEATVAPVLPSAAPTVEGARVTPQFKAICTDIVSVARAIVTGEIDLAWEVKGEMRPLLVVDQVVLNSIIKSMGKSFRCPGILVEDDVRIGAKRL